MVYDKAMSWYSVLGILRNKINMTSKQEEYQKVGLREIRSNDSA